MSKPIPPAASLPDPAVYPAATGNSRAGPGGTRASHLPYRECYSQKKESLQLADKTIADIMADLRSFWKWLVRREKEVEPIEFPRVDFELGWRNTIPKETQQAIIEEVHRICRAVDIKVGIAIEWLSRYYSIRPVELLHIQEGDFDFELRGVRILYNKRSGESFIFPIQACQPI